MTDLYEQEYSIFRAMLDADETLYNNWKTYVVQMRFSSDQTKKYYNLLKNELLSFTDKDKTKVTYKINKNSEEFVLNNTTIVKLMMIGGQFKFYIRLNPAAYSTSDAIHKDVSSIDEHKNTPLMIVINKEGRLNKAMSLIGDFMDYTGLSKEDNAFIDYASFFTRERLAAIRTDEKIDIEVEQDIRPDDIITIVEEPPVEPSLPEEPPHEEEITLDNRPTFDEYQNVEFYTDDKKSIFEPEAPKEEINQKKRRKSLWQELNEYGYSFMPIKRVLFGVIIALVCIALGIIYKLNFIFIVALCAFGLLIAPGGIKAYYRNKYEKRRFKDAETYIEQMLYSFRRNSKIMGALEDTLMIFPNGHMHDRIIEALDIIRDSQTTGNAYEQALKKIEDSYPCQRIKSLHRYMIKVEDVGGNHESGIQALLKDRRQWIDRTNLFRKKCSGIVKEIIVSCIFSFAMGLVLLYMLPRDMYDISQSIIYQIVSTIFLGLNLFTIKSTFSATVIYLQDEDKEKTNKTIHLLRLLKKYDKKAEAKKHIKQGLIFLVFIPVGLIIKLPWISVIGGLFAIFTMFIKRHIDYHSARKRAMREIEKVFPDWLLELALLLQSDNVHVAISKTIDSAPPILQDELIRLTDNLRKHPVELTPYISFFDYLPIESIQSSMKLLYSIRVFGASDESVQIAELVERNHTLMTKAEEMKNEDKLSKIFITKFLPMLSCSIKMMVDLMLFLMFFMSLLGGFM